MLAAGSVMLGRKSTEKLNFPRASANSDYTDAPFGSNHRVSLSANERPQSNSCGRLASARAEITSNGRGGSASTRSGSIVTRSEIAHASETARRKRHFFSRDSTKIGRAHV